MANREKIRRNQLILRLKSTGWRDQAIANMLHMTLDAVKQVLHRHKVKAARAALETQTEGKKGETNGRP